MGGLVLYTFSMLVTRFKQLQVSGIRMWCGHFGEYGCLCGCVGMGTQGEGGWGMCVGAEGTLSHFVSTCIHSANTLTCFALRGFIFASHICVTSAANLLNHAPCPCFPPLAAGCRLNMCMCPLLALSHILLPAVVPPRLVPSLLLTFVSLFCCHT